MSARARLQDMIRTERGDMNVYSQPEIQAALDACHAEVLAEAAKNLRAERANHATRSIFIEGIEHSAVLLTQWAEALRDEKDTAPRGASTPQPTGRVAQLLDAIRTARGQWPVHRAIAFYRDTIPALASMPDRHLHKVARGDLRDLAAWGHLERHGDGTPRRFYTYRTKGGTA